MQLNELFNEPATVMKWKQVNFTAGTMYKTTFSIDDNIVIFQFTTMENSPIAKKVFLINKIPFPETGLGYATAFQVNDKLNATGEMKTKATKVFVRVMSVMKNFLETHKWDYFFFTGNGESRAKLYKTLSAILATQFNAKSITDGNHFVVYREAQQSVDVVSHQP